MKSQATPRFRACHAALPTDVQARAESAFRRWQDDPRHSGLNCKKIHGFRPVWPVRIGLEHRAVGVVEGDVMSWFWIRTHADYDKLIRRFR